MWFSADHHLRNNFRHQFPIPLDLNYKGDRARCLLEEEEEELHKLLPANKADVTCAASDLGITTCLSSIFAYIQKHDVHQQNSMSPKTLPYATALPTAVTHGLLLSLMALLLCLLPAL